MHIHQIVEIFNNYFSSAFKTVILGGLDEPLYIPADLMITEDIAAEFPENHPIFEVSTYSRIYIRADYPRSALHEIAHWLVAGKKRRALLDYGYWYCPDGRTEQQQIEFGKVEILPQALEKLFCDLMGLDFSPSLDNLEIDISPESVELFSEKIVQKSEFMMEQFFKSELSRRQMKFIQKLMDVGNTSDAQQTLCDESGNGSQYTMPHENQILTTMN